MGLSDTWKAQARKASLHAIYSRLAAFDARQPSVDPRPYLSANERGEYDAYCAELLERKRLEPTILGWR